jgi:phosphoglycerate dehydrogenase-like enzyme
MKKLAQMTGIEAYHHYLTVADRRTAAAMRDYNAAISTRRTRLISAATKRLEAVAAIHGGVRRWQVKAAKERREVYGVGVAAGFLRSYGWTVEDAVNILAK